MENPLNTQFKKTIQGRYQLFVIFIKYKLSLYPYSYGRILPVGPGIAYVRKDNGKFDCELMLDGKKKHKSWSKKSLAWLNIMEKEYPFTNGDIVHRIQHVYNSGEKEVRNGNSRYLVDGYAEIDGVEHYLEFNGCR